MPIEPKNLASLTIINLAWSVTVALGTHCTPIQSLGDVKNNLANLAPNLVPLLQGWWLCNIFSSCTIDRDVEKWKGQTLLQCRYLSLACEEGILQNRQPSGWVGTQLWSMYIDIVLTSMRITSKKTGKVRCQLRMIWCHGMFGLARVNQHPPVDHAGWMDDGWIYVWMMIN
jgi:hypothetical protein